MDSWRARIGKVSPSRGDNYVYEFYKMIPDNILLTQMATAVKSLTKDDFSKAYDAYEEAALTLMREGVEILIFGGGPVFVSQGAGSEEALCARLRQATSLQVVTEISAAAAACKALGIRKLALISPYLPPLNGLMAAYFIEKGFQVPVIRGLNIEKNIEIGKLPQGAAYDLTMKTFREDAEVDGFFLTCSRWRTAGSIARLEKETGKPVITSVQATVWSALRALKIPDRIEGYGSLFSH
jgi:maleate cis-trans isomerase